MPRPALKTLIPYTLGIFAARYLSIPAFWSWLIVLVCLIGGLILPHLQKWRNQDFRTPYFLLTAIFACGMLRLSIFLTNPIPPEFYEQTVRFSGQTIYQPERGELWEECYAVGIIKRLSDPNRAVKAKLLIRFRRPVRLNYGDHFEVEGELRQASGKRNPGGFDYRAFLARRQVFGILYLATDQEIESTRHGGLFLLRWTERLRRRVESLIDEMYGEIPAHAQILKGMFLGKRTGFLITRIDLFRNSGVIHVLAVSGLHVGLIAAICFIGFSVLRIPLKITCGLTIVFVIIYACLVGFRASVLRASMLAILYLLGMIIDRDADPFNLVAFAALVLLLINPAQLWDVGFQLTFAATGAIIYFLRRWRPVTISLFPGLDGDIPDLPPDEEEPKQSRRIRAFLRRLPITLSERNWGRVMTWMIALFGVTLSAWVGTSPIAAHHFHRVYPIGLIASPFVVGLAAPIMGITLVSVILALILPPLATPFVYANHFFLFIFQTIVMFFGEGFIDAFGMQSWAVPKTPPPSLGFIVVYIAACLAIVHRRWVWEYRKIASLIGMTLFAIWAWDLALNARRNLLEVTFLDVGQGDAACVRFPDGKTMLVDGGANTNRIDFAEDGEIKLRGYDSGERVLDPFLCHESTFNIDLLLLSHPDNDHGGGFLHILHQFGVERVLGVPHRDLPPETHQALHEIIELKGIPHQLGTAGEIDLTPTARLELLHPFDEASINLTDRDVNNDSLVLKLSYGAVDILFTGDIGKEAEAALVSSGGDLDSEILKVPHHGSKTSSTAEFLDAVNPRYAVFSLGQRNRYHFPAAAVVERYRERDCRMLRTDQLGAIRLRTDGRRCWITSCVRER